MKLSLSRFLVLLLISSFFPLQAPVHGRRKIHFGHEPKKIERTPPPFLVRKRNVPVTQQKVKAPVSAQRNSTPAPIQPPSKKRILIFSSKGGGGHTAVSNGLNNYFKDRYEIKIVNVFEEILGPIDTMGTISFGKVTGEDVYNFCLRVRWTGVVGHIASSGSTYYNWRKGAIEKLLLEYFMYSKPDLLISVVPVINGVLHDVCKKLDIPVLVLTNDLDTTNYLSGLDKPTYAKFKYTLPFDDELLREKIKKASIPDSMIAITGFPLRPEFFKPKNIPALKKKFKVPEGKPVVMVFMGGAGSIASYRYVRILARMGYPMHIIVCLGRNERLKRNISKIALPADVTTTVLGFTDRIADLMAISDVLITKPGPGSVCESIESHLPMILDCTSGSIWWEELNISFAVKHGFGESLTAFQDLEKMLPKYLEDRSHVAAIKQKMKDFKRECFEEKIKPLVEQMIGDAPSTDSVQSEALKKTDSVKTDRIKNDSMKPIFTDCTNGNALVT